MSFDALLQEYVDLKIRCDQRAADDKFDADRMKEIEPLLVEGFGERGMQHVSMKGLTLYIAVDRFVNKKGGVDTADFCETLRECGLGDMVGDSYSSASLKARVLEWMEQGVEIPEAIRERLSIGEVFRLKSRKS